MKAYLYDVFHRCDSITDWIPTDCSLSLSSTQKVEGKYSIKLTSDAATKSYMRYGRGMNWSEFYDIVFSVYHPGYTNEVGSIGVYTDAANYKIWYFNFAASWTEKTIDLTSVPIISLGTLDLSNIAYIVIGEENLEDPGEDYYFDFIRGRSIDVTSDITDIKITEEMGVPSVVELDIKGESLDHFQAGLEMEVYDKDDVLSWRGRILFPEAVMEGTEVIGEIKALGTDSQFNNTYRKNFTTARDSDYIIKNVIDNALTKYHTYDDEIDNFTLTAKYDLKTKIQKMFLYLSMLERAVIGYKPDGEIFFNKYDNLSKGPQIYQGTYNFEDDDVGDEPAGWTVNEAANCSGLIKAELDGHKKVLELLDGNAAGLVNVTVPVTQGLNNTIEFYFTKSSIGAGTRIQISIREGATILIQLRFDNDDAKYYDGGAYQVLHSDFLVANKLSHFKLILDDTANTFDCYIDGALVSAGAGLTYWNNSASGANVFAITTDSGHTGYSGYFDAFGWDTDPSYSVGDNLKCWDESTSKIKITSYTPNANRHITRAPVIGANNDLGQVYYVGKASDAVEQKYGINYLQPWRDPEITNYAEAKQLGDNLLAIYSLDTQMIAMIAVGKGHLQVGKTLNLGWAGVFSITQGDFLLTKRIWYPIPDISVLELTDNILTKKAFNVKVINKFYDEDAQQSYDEPDVAESTMDGTVEALHSVAELRSPTYLNAVIKAVSCNMATGTYTGNGVNNRQITGLGFTPKHLILYWYTSNVCYSKNDQMGTWIVWKQSTTQFLDNYVKFIADGFEIDNNDNSPNWDTHTYYWTAWG
jgi:hypothetical protein